ncbi:MAG: sensor domain-containing protein [Thauera sp.]
MHAGSVAASRAWSSVTSPSPNGGGDMAESAPPGDESPQRLLEELRLHQAELVQQNEELQAAQLRSQIDQARYRSLFECLPIAAVLSDPNGILIELNDLAEGLFGRLPDKALAAGMLARFDRDDRLLVRSALQQAALGDDQVLSGLGLEAADGRLLVVDLRVRRLPGDGRAPQLLTLLQDRTPEQRNSLNSQILHALAESTDDLIFATDTEGRFVLANPALSRHFGVPAARIIGQARADLMPLRDALMHQRLDEEVRRTGRALTRAEFAHGRTGEREFLSHKFPLQDLHGRVIGVGGISRDVSEMRREAAAQRLSEAVFQHTREAIVVTDPEGRVERVNPAFEQLSGFSSVALQGRRMRILRSGRHDDEFYLRMWDALQEHGFWSGEITNRSATGKEYVVWSSISAIRHEDGTLRGYMAVQTDLTELHRARAEIEKLATRDSLTGLPNRALFHDRLHHAVQAARRKSAPFALLFIDLDHFKEVNDALGHHVGDALLVAVAGRLADALRESDTVARFGGDEFVVLLSETGREAAGPLAERLLDSVRQPVALEGLPEYRPQASVGVTVFPDDADSIEALLRNADHAMYAAKNAGRDQIRVYRADMGERAREAFNLQLELRDALLGGGLCIFLQPKFRLRDRSLLGAEVLVRWAHPRLGMLAPGVFLPVAQKHRLMTALDRWVLRAAMGQLSDWVGRGLWSPEWRLSINQNADDLRFEMAGDN